jgi:hypothetical protein
VIKAHADVILLSNGLLAVNGHNQKLILLIGVENGNMMILPNKLTQQTNHDTMQASTMEIYMTSDKFVLNDRAVICDTTDQFLDGKECTVIGVYAQFAECIFYIVSVDDLPTESHPWKAIVLTNACLRKKD